MARVGKTYDLKGLSATQSYTSVADLKKKRKKERQNRKKGRRK